MFPGIGPKYPCRRFFIEDSMNIWNWKNAAEKNPFARDVLSGRFRSGAGTAILLVSLVAISGVIVEAGMQGSPEASAASEKTEPETAFGELRGKTDLVLRIRGLPYAGNINSGGRSNTLVDEAHLLIRTKLLSGGNGTRQILIDARLVSVGGDKIWSRRFIGNYVNDALLHEEICRTLKEAMHFVGTGNDPLSI